MVAVDGLQGDGEAWVSFSQGEGTVAAPPQVTNAVKL